MFDLKSKLITKVKNLKGKRVLLRLDLNVPINESGEIEDSFRLESIIPTIQYLVDKKAKVIIIGHLGSDGKQSLSPVVTYLGKYFQTAFFPDLDNLFHIEDLKDGEVGIIENIRRADGEMANSLKIAKELASLADIYVNEAFSVSHRSHSSIVGITKYLPSYIGPLFFKEYENLIKVFTPEHPFLVILGGVKFQTKIPLLNRFIQTADNVFMGGALANSFYKKMGYEIGKSLVDTGLPNLTKFLQAKNFSLPIDVVTESGDNVFVRQLEGVKTKEIIVDVGPDTVEKLKKQITEAKFILWNGPLGNFEKNFNRGTMEIATSIADSQAFSVVGGGETLIAISNLGLTKKFGFVSTAGGAMLSFLANGTLPGIEAIKNSK